MFKKQIDILSIGDIATDAFIRLKDAHVHCKVNNESCELCLRFAEKIPFEYVKVIKAVGNAANVAVSVARLGLRSALVSNIGDDTNGHECIVELQKNKVDTSLVRVNKNKPTNYHFVLWFESDRTILVNHTEYDYKLPKPLYRESPSRSEPKWIYLTSIGANTLSYHAGIADYLEAHQKVKLAFQPGTFQISLGPVQLGRLYSRADIIVVNVEEARKILSVAHDPTTDTKTEIKDHTNNMNDIKSLLGGLAKYGPKLVLITDGPRGAYMFDGDCYYFMPMYPEPRPAFERTGCGDAFASTFVSALAMGKTPLEALTLAPINPMSVAQFIGSQEGLLTLDQLEWWLNRAPEDYKPKEI
jgi:sugar/nucleoside kinase (ribokinase family)